MVSHSLVFVTVCVIAFFIFNFTVGLGLPELPLFLMACVYMAMLLACAWAFEKKDILCNSIICLNKTFSVLLLTRIINTSNILDKFPFPFIQSDH